MAGGENVTRSTTDHETLVVMTVTPAVPTMAASTTDVGILTSITDMRRTGITVRTTAVFTGISGSAIIRTPITRGIAMFPVTDTTVVMATGIPTTTAMDIMARAALRRTGWCLAR